MLNIKKVIVGLSGGVDSAVTTLLLKNKGFNVEGVFMQNWDIADEQGECSVEKDYKDAIEISRKLNVKLHYVNFVKEYWNYVFSNFISDYESGFTPNPDIQCNRHIKFNYFINYARNVLNADAVATGHYARTSFGPYLENYEPNTKVRLLRALCLNKDQTFFLSQVKEESLRRVMFPLSDLMKSEVKKIAAQNGLGFIAAKKESMGICFIGSRNFQSFISEYIEDKPGRFINFDTNVTLGTHAGIHNWTVGQRSHLAVNTRIFYIVRKVKKNNNIFVVDDWSHPALFSDIFITGPPHWIHSKPAELAAGNVLECDFKFQHVEVVQKCTMCETKSGLVVNLFEPKRALTAGQYAVFYKGNECLGSARIVNPGPSLYFANKYKLVKSPMRRKYNRVLSDVQLDEENLKENVVCAQ